MIDITSSECTSGFVTRNSNFAKFGQYELFYSYGILFSLFDGEKCYRLKSPRRTTMQQFIKWSDGRVSVEVEMSELNEILEKVLKSLSSE